MNEALDRFDPTCTDGAKWYACEATASNRSPFVGCCKTDPCSISGCAIGNLTPVSFNASAYGTLPDPTCGSTSSFYSCVNIPKNDTTFWGCCKSNVCSTSDKACPKDDLTAAVLDNVSLQSAYSANGTTSNSDEEGGNSHTGVIVGAAVGGGVAVLAIIAILVFCLFKKRRARSKRGSASSAPANGSPAPDKTSYRDSAISEAPPLYDAPKPPTFAAFGQHQYQQVAQTSEPVEMPADVTAGSSQRYSELPAETTSSRPIQSPSELESPMISPYMSPRPSPRMPNSPHS